MIESTNTNALQGQYELDDLLPGNEGTGNRKQGTGMAEGYDAEGNLLNEDYPPLRTDVTKESPPPVMKVEAEEVPDIPQTSADADRLAALATEINAITEQTRGVVISAALAVGKRLIEAKSICPEGRFGEWLATSVSYSERKAQDMMRLYVEYGRDGAIPESIAALDYSKAVALLAAPADQREALAERAADEDLSVRQLQQEIKALKTENGQQQLVIDGLRRENDSVRDDGQALQDDNDRLTEELKEAKRVIADAAEKVTLAQAKAAAAEASADELRRLHSDAEDRAAASAQRASDAVNRANQTAKDLAEARAKIQALSEAAAAATVEPERVEIVPDAVQRELDDLRRQLAEARANAQGTGNSEQGTGMAQPAGAIEKFRWFYANQMKPTFTTALTLLQEVAREDGKAADAFATALNRACQQLMNQIGS